MNVLSYERSLHYSVGYKHVLLAGLSGLSLNCLLYGVSVSHLASLEALDVCRELSDGYICDGLCEVLEVSVAAYEVSLASKTYDDAFSAINTSLDRTL